MAASSLAEKLSPLAIPAIVVFYLLVIWIGRAFAPEEVLQVFPQYARVGAQVVEAPPPDEAALKAAEAAAAGKPGTALEPKPDVKPAAEAAASGPLNVAVGGRVLRSWEPVAGASVWARVVAANGNSFLVGTATTSDEGAFEIAGVVEPPGESSAVELQIDAKGGGGTGEEAQEDLFGQATLRLAKGVHVRRLKAAKLAIFGLPAVFFLSLWVAFLDTEPGLRRRIKYLTALTLAFAFTGCMIYGVAAGLSNVQDLKGRAEVLSLGYGFLFQGTYVGDGAAEWIYSFTSPEIAAGSEATGSVYSKGFGAPLWVILLSVIGSAVATISLLVVAIKDPPDTSDSSTQAEKLFGERIKQIVEHQFFILFAPLGAIFVYQLLVAAESANKSVTVALAALGSGPVLNYLLARAINLAKGVVQPEEGGDNGDGK